MAGKSKYVHVKFLRSLASPTFSFAINNEYDIERAWAEKLDKGGTVEILGNAPDPPKAEPVGDETGLPVFERMGKPDLIAFAEANGIELETRRIGKADLITLIRTELAKREEEEGEPDTGRTDPDGDTGDADPNENNGVNTRGSGTEEETGETQPNLSEPADGSGE